MLKETNKKYYDSIFVKNLYIVSYPKINPAFAGNALITAALHPR